ncbi:GIY-YIG nuclease family protein [Streptomyces sp. NPDC047917]|uniref:GIY-YIG nuclease family protein n=1 Tax=Streptomyces sp. NPDC047917 TaxID=3365491 RepID=UPI0037211EAB
MSAEVTGRPRVEQKWGFGMAPIKPPVQTERVRAAHTTLATLTKGRTAALGRLDDLSVIKGLFTRTYKKDQWDWFTVWSQLGFPAHRAARTVSGDLLALRRAIQDCETITTSRLISSLGSQGLVDTLQRYIDGTPLRRPGHGFIYVLSTREMPGILKVGYTDRDVATRAREINSSTGVPIPYGARGAWMVPHARHVESEVHALLAEYRLRKDREFFRMDFGQAAGLIDAYVSTMPASG